MTGAQFGTVVTLPVSGWLCDSDFLGGWPSVFYVFGSLGLLWSIAWFFLVFDHPDTHPRISPEEKIYILKNCPAKKNQVLIATLVFNVIALEWNFIVRFTEYTQ